MAARPSAAALDVEMRARKPTAPSLTAIVPGSADPSVLEDAGGFARGGLVDRWSRRPHAGDHGPARRGCDRHREVLRQAPGQRARAWTAFAMARATWRRAVARPRPVRGRRRPRTPAWLTSLTRPPKLWILSTSPAHHARVSRPTTARRAQRQCAARRNRHPPAFPADVGHRGPLAALAGRRPHRLARVDLRRRVRRRLRVAGLAQAIADGCARAPCCA